MTTPARHALDLAMSGTIIVGVDPGGHDTGIVVRQRDCLLWSDTVRRSPDEPVVHYALRVLQSVEAAIAEAAGEDAGRGLLAVEDVVDPNPHVRLTNPRGLIDTAIVVGVIVGRHPVVLVPPGGHGTGPLGWYPATLRPTRGQGRGKDRLRHVRSAWDVAGAAVVTLRMQQQGRPA